MAAFRVATNPADEVAWYRLLTRHRAIGKAHARALSAMLVQADPDSHPEVVAAAPPKARAGLQNTLRLLGRSQAETQASRIVEPATTQFGHSYVRTTPTGRDASKTSTGSRRPRRNNGICAPSSPSSPSIRPASSADYAHKPGLDEDYLTLSTVHSAKGLEWRRCT